MSSILLSTYAELSPDNLYRYVLGRVMDRPGIRALWIGVNPSTADADEDDASIRRLYGFAERLGIHEWMVGNLFAYRATNVEDLRFKTIYPVGDETDYFLNLMIGRADLIVAGWGRIDKLPSSLRYRVDQVTQMVHKAGHVLKCWGTCQDGSPRHPLYVPYSTPLEVWK